MTASRRAGETKSGRNKPAPSIASFRHTRPAAGWRATDAPAEWCVRACLIRFHIPHTCQETFYVPYSWQRGVLSSLCKPLHLATGLAPPVDFDMKAWVALDQNGDAGRAACRIFRTSAFAILACSNDADAFTCHGRHYQRLAFSIAVARPAFGSQ
jgi:hypothetical protein